MKKLMLVAVSFAAFAAPLAAKDEKSDKAGGQAKEHMSTQGQENTNAQSAPDASKGQARADERMSEQGQTHSKAGENDSDRKSKEHKKRAKSKKQGNKP